MGTDYRTFYDKTHLGHWDIAGKGDVTVTIERIERGELKGRNAKPDKKMIMHFVGATKPWICNITQATVIAEMYGPIAEEWVGKRITLFVGKSPKVAGRPGEVVDAVHVRGTKPKDEEKKGAA